MTANPAAPSQLVRVLRCPACAGALAVEDEALACPLGHALRIDGHGIVHLTEEPFYYREVPRAFFDGILAASDRAGARAAFTAALGTLATAKRDNLVVYALDPNRGGVALLGCTGPGTVSLDFGSGWGNLTSAIAHLGGDVVSVDMTYESLLYARLSAEGAAGRILHVRAGRHHPLPFADGSFDSVFLNGVLEWIPEGYMLDRDPREVHRMFLEEFRRILRPGGRLVVGIENRTSLLYFAGRPEDHTGLPFNALLPRRLADRNSRRRRGRPYRTYTYTHGGYRRLLRDAGFPNVEIGVPWMRYRNWNKILLGGALRRESVAPRKGGDPLRRRVAKVGVRALQPLGMLKLLAPDFYLFAPRPGGAAPSGLRRVLEEGGDGPDEVDVVRASSTHTLFFHTARWFYKVPLTLTAGDRLRADVDAVAALRTSPAAPWLVPECTWRSGVAPAHARYSYVRDDADVAVEDRVRVASEVVEALAAADSPARLADTGLGARLLRLEAGPLPDWLAAAGIAAVRAAAGRTLLASGPVHGDLTAHNVLVPRAGAPRIVDWDRYEACSPRFLDPMHLETQRRIRGGASWHDALHAASAGSGRHVEDAVDALGAALVARLYVLDRISKDLSAYADPASIPSHWHGTMAAAWGGLPPLGPLASSP